MNVLDLFTGSGGFTLGLERAGMRTVGFCEIDPFCREWLAQRWPHIPCYPNVRTLHGRAIGYVDLICGGFPCQDISAAGNGAGLDGERSGLWFEMLRILREVRSAWFLAENVPALRTRGADRVLSDLEESGYAAWPFVVGADDVGARHRRKRAWIVARRMADADRDTLRQLEQWMSWGWSRAIRNEGEIVAGTHGAGVADPLGARLRRLWVELRRKEQRDAYERREELANTQSGGLRADGRTSRSSGHADISRTHVADGDGRRCEGERIENDSGLECTPRSLAHGCGGSRDDDHRHRWPAGPGEVQHDWEAARTITDAECRLGVSADGLSARLGPTLNRARLKAAGNAIVPLIAEIFGRVILRIEQGHRV